MFVQLSPLTLVVVNVIAWPVIHLGVAYLGTQFTDSAFHPRNWLFRPRRWESSGRVYETFFRIRNWKDRLPDGAAWFAKGFPKKRLVSCKASYLDRFLRETCRSEAVHLTVLLMSFLFFVWNPPWIGWLMVLYAILANLPCIVTQRYNRLRLFRIRTP